MLAEQLLQLDLPYSEYWIPLAIGLGVGGLCVMLGRQVVWQTPAAPAPRPKEDYYDPFVQGSPTEQRKVPRRGGNPVEIYYARPEFKKNPARAWVSDRSVYGLCLWAGEELAIGTVLSVLPLNAPEVTPWVDIEVANCRPLDGGYEIGCKFVKSPPSLILMQFG